MPVSGFLPPCLGRSLWAVVHPQPLQHRQKFIPNCRYLTGQLANALLRPSLSMFPRNSHAQPLRKAPRTAITTVIIRYSFSVTILCQVR